MQAGAASATYSDDGLVLEISGDGSMCVGTTEPCVPLKVFQTGLVGDFDILASFQDFTGAGLLSKASLFVDDPESVEDYAEASIISSNGMLGASVTVSSGQTAQGANGNGGTLRIQREGDVVTATATIGSTANTIQGELAGEKLNVGLYVNPGSDATGPTRVTFADFSVDGDGVEADSFACDRLINSP
jgi:hypothetical protein